MEWQMTEMQTIALKDIVERKAGLDEMAMSLTRVASGIRMSEQKWWKQVLVEQNIPEQYKERLTADTVSGKIRLLDQAPRLVVPGAPQQRFPVVPGQAG